jgi:transcriptional regulator with GAF, ATPase, and Fis domain
MPELVEYFIKQFAASMDKAIESIPQETMGSLVRHDWPATFESSKTTSRVASFSPMMHKGVEPMTVGKSDLCAWPMRTEFAQSAVSDSAQDVPELVSFCCQIAQRRSGRRNL